MSGQQRALRVALPEPTEELERPEYWRYWQALPPRDFPNYAAGSWGPAAADELLTRDGRNWIRCGEC